ncbi:MAG: beta-carotene hydroxylase, partial [Sphingomonas sp.]
MTPIDKIAIVLLAVAGMELFAWSMHKYVMHGPGWGWHRDHHEPHDHALERNDLYAVVFAAIVVALFLVGTYAWPPMFWIATGITVYGAIYAFIHDGLVHQRL